MLHWVASEEEGHEYQSFIFLPTAGQGAVSDLVATWLTIANSSGSSSVCQLR